MSYYLLQDSETKGSYTLGQLRSMWHNGSICMNTLFCEAGYEKWLPLSVLQDKLEPPISVPTQSSAIFHSSPSNQVQTMEVTGKTWKMRQLVSSLISCIGFVVAVVGLVNVNFLFFVGLALTFAGLFALMFAKVGTWWDHG